ncbi:MAG: hypothetical protein J6W52_11155 [Bacteroidaceae bacterium]|nr:hypothetical protein [Bacteroidaceae bacterium]
MKRKCLSLTMFFLLIGMNMQAQSVSDEQMDEHFNDSVMPYGWFAEGWIVKNGVATKGSSSGGFNMETLMGGGSSVNYLMTPPLTVQEGESLVFSAKKAKESGMGSMMGGSSDSTFVVEYEVYSEHRWKKAFDFTTQLDSVYKDFTISGIAPGEYRFRFKAGGNVEIDSIAGFHIDMEAPDIYVIRGKAAATNVNLGVCTKDSTATFTVINTATGTLNTTIKIYDDMPYTLSTNELSVTAGDSATVDITYIYQNAVQGRNTTEISFKPADDRVYGMSYRVDAVTAEEGIWQETFNNSSRPDGWFTEGWQFKDNTASVIKPSDGMEGMMGGSSPSYYLLTPVLTIESPLQVLSFSARTTGSSGMGSMFGGGGSTFSVEKSLYGSNRWEKVKDFSNEIDTVFTTLWLSEMQPGDYRFRFMASDSIVIDSVAGFKLKEDAPDFYLTVDGTVGNDINLGMLNANASKNIMVINTGAGTLQVNVSLTDETFFAVNEKQLSVTAGDTARVEVTFLYSQEKQGMNNAVITFSPVSEVLKAQSVSIQAYTTYADAWSEDFEPVYVVENESQPLEFPVGWETTGWVVSKPSSGGMMSMFGGGGEEKSWMATTDSENYELITPRLQAKKGDVLQFLADMSGGGMMSMFGGGGSGMLQVYYQRENEGDWTLYGVYTQSGKVYFKAPFAGVYRLKFKGLSVSLDDFEGLRFPLEEVALTDGEDTNNTAVLEKYDGINVNMVYDRELSAVANGDGTWTPKAYTICLPYDWKMSDYMEGGKVKLYQLSYVDNYYKQFIFTEGSDFAEAGKAYLAVVELGSVRMNAADVTVHVTPADTDASPVNDYEKWFFNKEQTKIGTWQGTFRDIAAADAANVYMYCLRDDGSWGRFILNEENTMEPLKAFRGYLLTEQVMDDEYTMNPASARARAPRIVGNSYQTMFGNNGEVTDQPNLLYEGDIPIMSSDDATGISPVIHTIDQDGTNRYYDLQGRLLTRMPQKGIFINNGKKIINQ